MRGVLTRHGMNLSDRPRFHWISSSFLRDCWIRPQHLDGMLESARRTGKTKEEFVMMGWYGNGTGSLGWLGMGVFWLILLGLIVWLVMRLLPGSGGGTTRNTGESALEILDRRLANGQIDLEPWQTQRAALLGVQDARK
jgi:putative membrane protein